MKNMRSVIFIIVCGFVFSAWAHGQNVYELRCRGGSNLRFTTVGSRTHSSGAEMVTLELAFAPTLQTAGANSAGLQPGECGFVGRAFYRDEVGQIREPLKVRFETPANAQLKQTQHGSPVDRSPTAAERYPDAMTIPIYLASPNRYWSFQVFNAGHGYFEASGHQPWKKMFEERMIPRSRIVRNF